MRMSKCPRCGYRHKRTKAQREYAGRWWVRVGAVGLLVLFFVSMVIAIGGGV